MVFRRSCQIPPVLSSPSRADGEGPRNCSAACLRESRAVHGFGVVGRKLTRISAVRSLAVCAIRDDSKLAPSLDLLLLITIAHLQQNHGSFSVIDHGEYWPRVQRRPAFACDDLLLLFGLHEQIARVQRDLVD